MAPRTQSTSPPQRPNISSRGKAFETLKSRCLQTGLMAPRPIEEIPKPLKQHMTAAHKTAIAASLRDIEGYDAAIFNIVSALLDPEDKSKDATGSAFQDGQVMMDQRNVRVRAHADLVLEVKTKAYRTRKSEIDEKKRREAVKKGKGEPAGRESKIGGAVGKEKQENKRARRAKKGVARKVSRGRD